MPAASGNTTKSRHTRLFVSLGLSLGLHAVALVLPPGILGPQDSRVMRNTVGQMLTVAIVTQSSEPTPPSIEPPDRQHDGSRTLADWKRNHSYPTDSVALAEPVDSTSAAPTGVVPVPWYYPARLLHRRVTPLKPIWPHYPAKAEGVAGLVKLLLFVNETGGIDRFKILHAEPGDIFEESVIEAFVHQARYAPGKVNRIPVKGQLLAEIRFEPGTPPRIDFSIMEPSQPFQDASKSLGKEN